MATSSVDICNSALILLGATPIVTLADNTKEAILCNHEYSKVLKEFLGGHPWNFATYRTEIAADGALPTGWWGWTYAHSLASDVIRVLDIEDSDTGLAWAVESGRKIMADHTPVRPVYIKNVTDTTLFPAYFEKALVYQLAIRISYSLTQSATLIQQLRTDADMAVREARSFDAQEKSLQQVAAEEYINARY